MLCSASPARAATFTVNSTLDGVDATPGNGVCATAVGTCTLRAAIQEANALPGTDVVILPAGTYQLTLVGAGDDAGATGDLDITDTVSVVGTSPISTIVDATGVGDRVFHVVSGASVQIRGITIRGGVAPASEFGGGILISTADVIIANAVVRDNATSGDEGGGIANEDGTVTVRQSSLINNTAVCGAGLFNFGVLVTIESVTFSGNVADCTGGGLLDAGFGGDTFVTNSTFVGNTPNNIAGTDATLHLANTLLVPATGQVNCDIFPIGGNIDDGGNFVATVDCGTIATTANAALVQSLALDPPSGQFVHRPLAGNPVIDGGNAGICGTLAVQQDQRGIARAQGAACDAGAVEIVPPAFTSGAVAGATWNTAYAAHTFTATGETAITFSIAAGALPTGMSLAAGGALTGTPTAFTGAPFNFTVRATSAVGQTVDQATSITVAGTLASVTGVPPGGSFNTPYNFIFGGTGNGALTFAISAGALPNGLSISAAGVVTGTPTALGTFNFTVSVTDASAQTATLARSIVITGAAISITGTPPAGITGTAYAFTFSGTGNGALTYSLDAGMLPPGVGLSAAGQLSGTPTVAGSYAISVRVTDAAALTATRAVPITIAEPPPPPPPPPPSQPPPNRAPGISGLSDVTVEENGLVSSIPLSITDDGSADAVSVTVSAVDSTIISSATITGSGASRSLQLVLAEDRHGIATIELMASDGQLASIASARVTVTPAPIPQPPVNLTVVPDGTGALFSWQAAPTGSTPTFFLLEGGNASGQVTLPVINTGRAMTERLPVPAGQWFFRVRSGNGAGTSLPSNEVSGIVPSVVRTPGAPSTLTVVVNGGTVQLAWLSPVDGGDISAWDVEIGTTLGASDRGTFRLLPSTLNVAAVFSDGQYVARVRGVNGSGTGPASNEVRFVVGAPGCTPGAVDPPVLYPAARANRLVTLAWRPAATGLAGTYRILVGSAPGLVNLIAFDVGSVTAFAATAPPGRYFVSVMALTPCGQSVTSNEIVVDVP